MTEQKLSVRLQSLLKIVEAELNHLNRTDARLFAVPLTIEQINQLSNNDALAEQVDAFVVRFGRLQDTVGDKLIPAFLIAMAEIPKTSLENLDRAEKLGLIQSADAWQSLRKMRNRMIHEYVAETDQLLDALESAHKNIPVLAEAVVNIKNRLARVFPQLTTSNSES